MRRIVIGLTTLLVAYLVVAYLVMPVVWSWYVWDHPTLDAIPHSTSTADGLPGDPLNVALIGTETALKKMLLAAKWDQADPLTFRSSLEIAEAAVLDRPYANAPVSTLYLWGRKEDLAFEQPVGDNPRQRHHVRLWRADQVDRDGRPVWVGAAIYDTRVGFSDTTGQITHHTAADIDAERDKLLHDLKHTGDLSAVYTIKGFHKILRGRNGGGDPWHTDGGLAVGVITR